MFRRWKPWQILPPVLSVAAYLVLTALPDPLGMILVQLLPGWFAAYTPSTLLKGLFVRDRRGRLHWATSGQYTPKLLSEVYDCFMLLMAVCSFIVGWYTAALNALSVLSEIQAAMTVLLSGGGYGLLMGHVASMDREVYPSPFW